MRGIAASVWETPMTEPRKTAGMIQKYSAVNAMLWASTLIQIVVLEVSNAAAALPIAIANVPMKKHWATIMGRNFVARSAASASAV